MTGAWPITAVTAHPPTPHSSLAHPHTDSAPVSIRNLSIKLDRWMLRVLSAFGCGCINSRVCVCGERQSNIYPKSVYKVVFLKLLAPKLPPLLCGIRRLACWLSGAWVAFCCAVTKRSQSPKTQQPAPSPPDRTCARSSTLYRCAC